MAKNDKEFNREICFTFYREWAEMAKEIETDFGKEVVADYYNAIINYALFEIEPEMKAPIKYFWAQMKEKIDASQENRSRGFSKENKEMTEKVLKYKEEHPDASYRDIEKATGISKSKVGKVLTGTVTVTPTVTDTVTDTITITTVDVDTVDSVDTSLSTGEQTKITKIKSFLLENGIVEDDFELEEKRETKDRTYFIKDSFDISKIDPKEILSMISTEKYGSKNFIQLIAEYLPKVTGADRYTLAFICEQISEYNRKKEYTGTRVISDEEADALGLNGLEYLWEDE